MNITYHRASKKEDLLQIIALQRKNSVTVVSEKNQLQEGFVTVSHSYELLKRMNDACPHIIAKDGDKLVGYALVMLETFKDEISLLNSMFKTASRILGQKRYLAMGQICIDKAYRGHGIFRAIYSYYKAEFKNEYDCLVTEVASKNQRSLQAHLSVGFKILDTKKKGDTSWELICWSWK